MATALPRKKQGTRKAFLILVIRGGSSRTSPLPRASGQRVKRKPAKSGAASGGRRVRGGSVEDDLLRGQVEPFDMRL